MSKGKPKQIPLLLVSCFIAYNEDNTGCVTGRNKTFHNSKGQRVSVHTLKWQGRIKGIMYLYWVEQRQQFNGILLYWLWALYICIGALTVYFDSNAALIHWEISNEYDCVLLDFQQALLSTIHFYCLLWVGLDYGYKMCTYVPQILLLLHNL